MTDFYAILKSIIAESGAEEAEHRASLYARARGVLDRQLDSLSPPLSTAARQQQRERLEDAVRRIEAEIASRPAATGPASAARPQPPRPEPEEEAAPLPTVQAETSRRRHGGAALIAAFILLIIAAGGAVAYWRWEMVAPPLASLIDELRSRLGGDGVEGSPEPMREETATDVGAPEKKPGEPPAPMQVMEDQPQAPSPAGTDGAAGRPLAEAGSPAAAPPPQGEAVGPPDKDEARVPSTALASERAYLLIEQDPAGNEEKRFAGTALWRLDGSGADTGLAVAVSIPERPAEFSVVIRANADPSLSASHTIDLVYRGPADADGLVTNVPGFMVRLENGDSSIPLRGAGALVFPGQYLMGLSGAPADRAYNMNLLQKAEWMVIPAEFESKRRSVFVIEKGMSGAAAMAQAFAAWEAARSQ